MCPSLPLVRIRGRRVLVASLAEFWWNSRSIQHPCSFAPDSGRFAITTALPRFFSCLNPATLAMPAARLLSKSEQTLGLRTSTP